MIAFGPVPSRRLGRSLGINHIPPKVCTYACVYCQLGRTLQMQANRQTFYQPEHILEAVRDQVHRVRSAGEPIDYLTFVPDGEPTLDLNLGRAIELLRPLGIPIAVITNASLIGRADVRTDLAKADWVSLKVDAVAEKIWRRIDRPHGVLRLDALLEGALEFAAAFSGVLATETMLVAGVNDGAATVREIAGFVARLQPAMAYLAVPTRPPAEAWVRPPGEDVLNRAYQIFSERVDQVEYLIGYEGNAFTFTGNVAEDLLAITAVHPMRQDAVAELLARARAGWPIVHRLVAQGHLVETEYGGHTFFLRRLQGSEAAPAGRRAAPSQDEI
jgi:wyosine [tRNA(Phe)-imidazoG37] synthetase (radical SAM superfamily)